MIEIIVNGIQFGIVLTFLVGPVFFTIMQTSIERGFWKGVLVAFGVSISDILYVTICYFGFAQMMADSKLKMYMAYAGGGILIGFGLYHLLVKSRAAQQKQSESVTEKRLYRYVVKGFLINGMTPMVLFFWIGTVSYATINFGYTKIGQFALFFAFLLGTVLSTDILKADLADKLRVIINARSLKIMNVVLGIVLIYFGLRLLFDSKTLLLQ